MTIPRRIGGGFLSLVLLAVLLGAVALWRIGDMQTQVAVLAGNTVPSLVTLTEIAQSTQKSGRAARRVLMLSGDTEQIAAARATYESGKQAGNAAVAAYQRFVSDEEDARLFRAAVAARERFLASADRLLTLAQAGNKAEAQACLIQEVDPAIEACVAEFTTVSAYNAKLSARAVSAAQGVVAASRRQIGGLVGINGLLGGLVCWLISRGVARALGGLSDSMEQGATQTAMAAGQLAAASDSLAMGCSEQGSSVAETSAALEQMSVMIRSTADNADKAKALAKQARDAAQGGAQTMVEMNAAMHAIEASSAEVAKIVKNIDEIAFQTNILALNAAVEAARAGEAGAGFAVVADEVRSLAQRSAAAAKETAEKIEAAIAKSKQGAASCGRVGESLQEIVTKVTSADGLVAEIATAAKEQSQGIEQVGVAMVQLDKVTQGNASSAEESANAASQLNGQVHAMQDTVLALRALVGRDTGRGANGTPALRKPMRGPTPPPRSSRPVLPRKRMPRIDMPDDSAAPDEEDKNFTNF